MKTFDLASNLIKLRILSRRLLQCEDGEKKLISLKTKLLFLLCEHGSLTPAEIMDLLKISKPNLTMLGNALTAEGLIMREALTDRRSIIYTATRKGRDYINERLERIGFNIIGEGIKDPAALCDAIEQVLEFAD